MPRKLDIASLTNLVWEHQIACPSCGGRGIIDRDDLNFPECGLCNGYGRIQPARLLREIAREQAIGTRDARARAKAWEETLKRWEKAHRSKTLAVIGG